MIRLNTERSESLKIEKTEHNASRQDVSLEKNLANDLKLPQGLTAKLGEKLKNGDRLVKIQDSSGKLLVRGAVKVEGSHVKEGYFLAASKLTTPEHFSDFGKVLKSLNTLPQDKKNIGSLVYIGNRDNGDTIVLTEKAEGQMGYRAFVISKDERIAEWKSEGFIRGTLANGALVTTLVSPKGEKLTLHRGDSRFPESSGPAKLRIAGIEETLKDLGEPTSL